MKAEIISVGTEILLGEILDTNSRYLAARLPPLGIDLYYISKVGDNLNRLAGTIGRAHERSDLVLITGGLGPTEDDLTREAIALALDEEMFVDADTEQRLRAFFAARGFPFPERNVKQAMLIPSAQAIPNPRGTAPGWWVEKDGRIIVAMPGPPPELERMWEVEVAPRLAQLGTGEVIISRTLKTIGIGEGHLDDTPGPPPGPRRRRRPAPSSSRWRSRCEAGWRPPSGAPMTTRWRRSSAPCSTSAASPWRRWSRAPAACSPPRSRMCRAARPTSRAATWPTPAA